MSRTQLRIDCDTGYEDGIIDLGATDFFSLGGAATLTRNAKGDVSWNQASSLTDIFDCPLSTLLFRTGLSDYTQEAFGAGGAGGSPFGAGGGGRVGTPTTTSTANANAAGNGVAVSITVQASGLFVVGRQAVIDAGGVQEVQTITSVPDATHIIVRQLQFNHATPFTVSQGTFTTPWGTSGVAPFSGTSQFTPPTARPKGMLVRGMEVRYFVGTLALTSISVGLAKTIFKNATALAVTDILAPGANGLTTAVSTNMTVLPVAIVNPTYLTQDLSEYTVEVQAVTPATSTFKFYGATLYVTYNYN